MIDDPRIVMEQTLSFRLPCGHVLQHLHKTIGKPTSKDLLLGLNEAVGFFDYWVRDRAANHRCELVSPENPQGLVPFKDRKGVTEKNPMTEDEITK